MFQRGGSDLDSWLSFNDIAEFLNKKDQHGENWDIFTYAIPFLGDI
jgi:hypothetical protein